jgi:3-oxoacyl-[acyl-carrier protein] reductase
LVKIIRREEKMRLKDRVAIVTGGGRGLGKAFCLKLAEEGAKVAIADINIENAQQVVKEIEGAGGEAFAQKTDVSIESEAQALAKAVIDKFGKIDLLVNNAAYMAECSFKPLFAYTEEEWDRCYAVNVKGVWLCSKAVIPHMQQQKKGKIINIADWGIHTGQPFLLPYISSKGAVHIMTRSMAMELGESNIGVNCIAPGYIPETEGMQSMGGKPFATDMMITMMQSIRRQEHPRDVVGTLIFLASDDANFITGHLIEVDGGFALH